MPTTAWRQKNPEKARAQRIRELTERRRQTKEIPLAARARFRLKQKRYREKYPEKMREIKRKEYFKHSKRYKSYSLTRLYGISLTDWETIFEAQNRRCACCGSDNPHDKIGRWQTDHCHETKKIRGILCSRCNRALGHSKEDIARLEALIRYLKSHAGPENPGM